MKAFLEQAKLGHRVLTVTFRGIIHPGLVRKEKKVKRKKIKETIKPRTNVRRKRKENRKSSVLKEKREQRKISKATFLKEKADILNENLPRSEQWFWSLYGIFSHYEDKMNVPFLGKIPDVINEKFKYIIEVDGTYHNLKSQKKKDREKDILFSKNGYTVIRVKAYDQTSFNKCLSQLRSIRGV